MIFATADTENGSSRETAISAVVAPEPMPEPANERKPRPVAVTGASGFVGTHVCRELARAGWPIRAMVRDTGKAASRLGDVPLEIKVGDLKDTDFVKSCLEDAEAVIHLAAIAIEKKGGPTYEEVNTNHTLKLLELAHEAGATRFIHMSQNGSDSKSPYRFLKSKGVAEDAVTASSLRWTVLRPSVIFGPEDEFVNVLARLIRITPLVLPLPNGGRAKFQPVYVGNVAQAVVGALGNDKTVRGMYSLGGPAPLTLRQMAERILAALQTKRLIMPIPVSLLKPVLAVAQRIIPNPPVTTSLLDLLNVDNTIEANALTDVFGIEPTPFAVEELVYLRRIRALDAIRGMLGR